MILSINDSSIKLKLKKMYEIIYIKYLEQCLACGKVPINYAINIIIILERYTPSMGRKIVAETGKWPERNSGTSTEVVFSNPSSGAGMERGHSGWAGTGRRGRLWVNALEWGEGKEGKQSPVVLVWKNGWEARSFPCRRGIQGIEKRVEMETWHRGSVEGLLIRADPGLRLASSRSWSTLLTSTERLSRWEKRSHCPCPRRPPSALLRMVGRTSVISYAVSSLPTLFIVKSYRFVLNRQHEIFQCHILSRL